MESYVLALHLAVFAAALLQAATGIGFGIIAGPIILMVMNSASAIQVSILLSLMIALMLAPSLYGRADKPLLARLLLGAMAGHDPKDSTSVDTPVPDYEAALTGEVRGLKIGIPKEYRLDGTPGEIEALWQQGIDWLKAAGAEIVDISLPHTSYALPAYYIVAPAEASSNLARYDGVRYGLRVPGETLDEMYEATRGEGFGPEVKRRVLIGTYVLSAGYYDAYYNKARRVRTLIARDFSQAFETVDAILTPTAPSDAFAVGDKMDDPIAMYLNDVFTVPASMAGLPAISVPAGLSADGLPLGLHLIARAFDETTMFKVAEVLEQAAGFDARPQFVAGDGR